MRPTITTALLLAISTTALARAEVARADEASAPMVPLAHAEVQSRAEPRTPAPATHMKSAPMLGVGVFLAAAGIPFIIAGAVGIANDPNGDLGRIVGGGSIGLGAAHLIPGVIMIIVGAQQIAVTPSASAPRVSLRLSPSGVGLATSW